jgi:hypothetical protein
VIADVDRDVEHDERARGGEGAFPGGVREQEHGHVTLRAQEAPGGRQIAADAAEDTIAGLARLVHEHDRGQAAERRRDDGDEERERLPHVEEEAAAYERAADREPAQHVLDALGPSELARGQQVRVEAAVRRLVDVVGEEEREDEERRRPEVRHEGDEREAEGDRADRDEHERAPAAERRMERVAPGADDERQRDREHALGGEDERDQARRAGELAENRRQVGRRRRDGEREPEGAEAERPRQSALRPRQRDDTRLGPRRRHRTSLSGTMAGMEGGFGFLGGGDPDELMRNLQEFAARQAESVQEAQREQFATLTLNTAVELTAAALNQISPAGGADEQAIALRDAMRVLFPEAVALVSAARQGFMRET